MDIIPNGISSHNTNIIQQTLMELNVKRTSSLIHVKQKYQIKSNQTYRLWVV